MEKNRSNSRPTSWSDRKQDLCKGCTAKWTTKWLKLARIEEIADDDDRWVRENNVILHGVKEGEDESAEERSAKDKIYVNEFFETLEETGRTPSFIGRIGKKTEKNRLIKIAFNSKTDKKQYSRS